MSLCCPVPVFFLRRHTLGASANQHAVLTTPLPTHFSTDSLSTSVVWGSPRAPCSLCWIPSLMIFWSSLQLVHYSVILWTSLSGLVYCIWVCRFFENKLTINCSTRLENDQIIMEKESLEIGGVFTSCCRLFGVVCAVIVDCEDKVSVCFLSRAAVYESTVVLSFYGPFYTFLLTERWHKLWDMEHDIQWLKT